MLKKLLIPVLILAAFALAAGAEEYCPTWTVSLWGISVSAADLGVKRGTEFPVYASPFKDAYRGAKGKAKVTTGGEIWLISVSPDEKWALVRYEVSRSAGRIGWIHAPNLKMPDTEYEISFTPEWLPLRAVRNVDLTDDPLGEGRVITRLKAGDTVTALTGAEANGTELVYVETQVGGKTAYLFGRRDAFEAVPLARIEDGVMTVAEGVTHMGRLYEYVYSDEGDLMGVEGPELTPGIVCCPYLDSWIGDGSLCRALELPSTLTYLGREALGSWYLDVLRLPDGLETVKADAFSGGGIGEMIVPASVTDGEGLILSNNEYMSLERYTVLEGNPVYRDIDGVLYDVSGTLLSYPDRRPGTHYDVPAGTVAIGDGAFSDSMMSIPLETVSLPMGLKSIGRRAFSGCGRLISLTVPLTVKSIDPTAFYNCVSLERLSLPRGFTALKNDGQDFWVRFNDFTYYNGDNGETGTSGDTLDRYLVFSGYLRGADGLGCVKIYRSPGDEAPCWITDDGLMADIRGTDEATGRLRFSPWSVRNLPETLRDAEELYADAADLVPTAGRCLFDYASVTVSRGVLDADTGEELPFDEVREWNYYTGRLVNVYLGEDADWRAVFASVGDENVTLRREYTGDDRTLGILVASSPRATVTLMDEDGDPTAEAFTGEQAEVIGEKDALLKIRSAFGTHYILRECLRVVPQADPE